ncbi:hypothetical protein BKA66DRAFT_437708 [Pyrenochaeta sp. MPI-SDFR-AT-0127]|nr:hypothetical protein BKA66DRAFT_437708 [Pyrenochaeta sp. MPI-SDFR-AT-0127]
MERVSKWVLTLICCSPAYTPRVNPSTGGSPDPSHPYANSVIFCPRFWTSEFQYVNSITEKTGRTLKNIDDLHSYEHVLIHEWFHNSKNDVGKWHVTDLKGDYGDGTRNIYGSYACQHYAWRQVLKGGGVGDIELETMSNADSWAWMISYNWFKKIYKWNDDGSMKPKIQLRAGEEDPEAETDPYKDLPLDKYAVEKSNISEQEGYTSPEATTRNRDKCPNCLVTSGGCVAVPECRYPKPDGTVDPACTHCTCDISTTDKSTSTEDLSLSNKRCAGWIGKLPKGYVWPPLPTTPPKRKDFDCNCGESGCSAESAPCCANGTCKCSCGESGCAAEDPECCANGTCHFGTMRMLF